MNKERQNLLIILVVILGLLGFFYYVIIPYKEIKLQPYYSSHSTSLYSSKHREYIVMPNHRIIEIETVATKLDRDQGLSGRDQMANNEGMWFVFEREDIYPFWMKDMKFDIDIIWINDDYYITDIARNVPVPTGNDLPTYSNTQPARYVLEVNAGVSNSLVVGDQLNKLTDI